MINIDDFEYPLPAREAKEIIDKHDAEWVKYWTETNHKGLYPKDDPKYEQAYIETLYSNEPAKRGPYTEIEFVNAIKSKRIESKDGDLPSEFVRNYIQANAETMACEVNQVWASYGSMFVNPAWGHKFQPGYYYNYFKAIACGLDPKSAYYRAVARAMDDML